MDKYLDFMEALASQAGKLMLQHIYAGLTIGLKGDKTAVSSMDQAVHELVVAEVGRAYPNNAVLGEEGSKRGTSRFMFSVDETDGTVVAVLGMAHFVFSIALLERIHTGELVCRAAVVHNPTQQLTYSAVKGKGAYCNSKLLSVNDRRLGVGTYVDMEWWPQAPSHLAYLPDAATRLSLDTGTYCLTPGSAINGAMLVASGGFAALVFAGASIDKVPDITASSLIVTEAGGKVSDLQGNPLDFESFSNGALFSNGVVHDELLSWIGHPA